MTLVILATGPAMQGQNPADEDFHVYRDAPRIILTPQRLRLVQRERERQSPRWEQFDALITGGAPLPEPGFAWALYYQVTRQAPAAKKAIDWALGDTKDATDLRQLALVFDWCSPAMSATQSSSLAAKIQRVLAAPAAATANDVRSQSARVLAAIALADRLPDQGDAILRDVIQKWWRGQIVPQLALGRPALARDQRYALYEMLHALRDNLRIDLRESAAAYFQQLPIAHLAGHYPAPFAAPENEFLIPAYLHDGNPDPAEATLSRAAGLAMVAYDTNALESQLLQGWLMRDRFVMRGGLGAVYEFLWANPYQPGLNYDHVPLVFHQPQTGEVFARTTWDEDATWMGYFEGRLQLFQNGSLQTLKKGASVKPLQVGTATIASAPAPDAGKFRLENETLFVLGLTPQSEYAVEIDDQKLELLNTDAAGTLLVPAGASADVGVRVRLRGPMQPPGPDAIK
ncbi:MAG TPA: hypothetical protein VGJ09_13885 [Bryobacteraceae bacterium]